MTHNAHPTLNQIKLPPKVAVLGKGMTKNNALLSTVLQTHILRYYPITETIPINTSANNVDAFIGWGNKKSYQRAKKQANRKKLPVYSIEDGFIRSIDSGTGSHYGLSIIIDDLGIYFNLHTPSRLEEMICHRLNHQLDNQQHTHGNPEIWSSKHQQAAQILIKKIVTNKLSKYNHSLDCPDLNQLLTDNLTTTDIPPSEHILLVDQVQGDNSVKGAGATKKQFNQMIKDACNNHPTAHIWIKTHPANKQGYLTQISLPKKHHHRIHVITQSVNPIALLTQIRHLYTVSSHMGFEALMLQSLGTDIQVHCYGVSWYSGWGLTDDRGLVGKCKKLIQTVKKRRLQLTVEHSAAKKDVTANIEQLFFAAYLDYSHYLDPASQKSCDIYTAIDWLLINRHWHVKFKGKLTVYEFSRWKLPFVRAFVGFPNTEITIKPKPKLNPVSRIAQVVTSIHDLNSLKDAQSVLIWGLKKRQEIIKQKNPNHSTFNPTRQLYCMEDGFIRSNGLGATLLAPLSVVIDRQGIYYNATEPSDLEDLLKNCPDLNSEQKQRVTQLHHRLLNQKVSKYNVGQKIAKKKIVNDKKINQHATENLLNNYNCQWFSNVQKTTKRQILIVGQVEDDLSIQYCGSLVKTNAELIRRVHKNNPEAYLIYKPHPDVEAGLRIGNVDKKTLQLVNAIAHELAMPDCLELIDEVHTISSLTGFEALLRGKSVTCYGLPFYAGWGLTTDIDKQQSPKSEYLQRRQRDCNLTLEQLIYCTLIAYPIYRLPNGYGLAQVEQVIDYLYGSPSTESLSEHPNNQSQSTKYINKQRLINYSKQKLMQNRLKVVTLLSKGKKL